jgi:ubiquinone/menaquinone biosynthesis C-methylase UbiE
MTGRERLPRIPEPEVMSDAEEAAAYAAADFSAVNARFTARLLALAGRHRGLVVVDLGTGPAEIPARVARARPGWRVTAVDASAPMLQAARRNIRAARVGRAVRLVRADALRSDLPAGAFDIVISNSLLHHLPDPDALWKEIRRLGKPGALVFVRDLRRAPTRARARRIVAAYAQDEPLRLKESFYNSLLAAFTPAEIRAQLRRAGLGKLRIVLSSDRHVDVVGRLPEPRAAPPSSVMMSGTCLSTITLRAPREVSARRR